ncbi:Fatty acid desaturase [Candidatus Rhodobacter oscarellae]|uniref:Fatty acid desaturase n=1 Tax=Candidatus Rhodobacter oscarellae TaxID=1675527 RepID=A0A0J9GUY9_9RHOB|nr:fatty acid desaturase [Candidatus Rhodobacter lobularis]KMW57393.1 Fatty acid desaturase [Candidatus Rhodobacter lobularis]
MDQSPSQLPSGGKKAGISPQARRHNDLRRQAIAAHPELKEVSGADPRTVFALPVILAAHWGMAWAVSGAPIWVIFIAAFFWGQIAIHAAGSLVHETAHKLIFRAERPKLLFDLGLEWILGSYGKQLTYQHEHITSHHPFIGDYERDYEHEDICAFQSRMQLRHDNPIIQRLLTGLTLVIHGLPLGFLIGDEVLPRMNAWISGRPQKDPERVIEATRPPRWQVRVFIAASLASNIMLLLLFGPWALLYHLWALSLFLGKLGIWNLGQSLSEHEGTDDTAPSRSTYGWINLPLFNTGYHNEHHTFPNVAWTRLPKLTRTAPEVFDIRAEKSYFGYWLDHIRGDFTASRGSPLHDEDNAERCQGRAERTSV